MHSTLEHVLSCFPTLAKADWVTIGWHLLQTLAHFSERLSSSDALSQVSRIRKYCALLDGVLSSRTVGPSKISQAPSYTILDSPLGEELPPKRDSSSVTLQNRHRPTGWLVGSDRFARIAHASVANVEKSVVRLVHDCTTSGPLGESETTQDFLEYLEERMC